MVHKQVLVLITHRQQQKAAMQAEEKRLEQEVLLRVAAETSFVSADEYQEHTVDVNLGEIF